MFFFIKKIPWRDSSPAGLQAPGLWRDEDRQQCVLAVELQRLVSSLVEPPFASSECEKKIIVIHKLCMDVIVFC